MSLFQTDEAEPTPPVRERAGGRVVWLVVIGLVLLVAAGYVAAYLTAGDKVPRGTTVAGVEIGGLEHAAAVEELEDGVADRLDDPIQVEIDGRSETVDPVAAGLAIDYEASVEAAGSERSWSPGRLWDYFTGGGDAEAAVTVDDDAMTAAIGRLEGRAGKPAKNGKWRFSGDRPKEIDPVVGHGLDREVTEDELVTAFREGLDGDDATAELERTELQPDIGAEEMKRAREEFVNPAMSAAVTFTFGKSEVQLLPKDYVRALRLTPKGDRLQPGVKKKEMRRLVDSVTAERGKPVDATVRLVNGKPKVVPGKPGVKYDLDEVSSKFLDVVTAKGNDRRAKVKGKADRPDFTTKEARELGIKERVSEFTTSYPHSEYRNVNIGRAAEKINGTVLKPGEVFSLNGIVGERTAENGFTEGYIISGGLLKKDFGGGVSQIATTTFNAMFFAGLKDIEHKPHSFYIDRYPVGREATVAWPTVDLKFENDTEYGVLIEAFINPSTYSSKGSVTVRMYSTKTWDISTKKSERYNYVGPGTRTLPAGPDCEPHTGWSGFDIDVWRYFKEPGSDEVVKTEKFHTDYTPSDTVVCKEPEPEPSPDDGGNNNNGGGGNNNRGGGGGNN